MSEVYLAMDGDRLLASLDGKSVQVVCRLKGLSAMKREDLFRNVVIAHHRMMFRVGQQNMVFQELHGYDTRLKNHTPKWFGDLLMKAHYRRCGESRPKETAEVAEATVKSADSTLHGGDGNSGEVDSKAETTAEERREAQEVAEEVAAQTKEREEALRQEYTKGIYKPRDFRGQGKLATPVIQPTVLPSEGSGRALMKSLKRLFTGWTAAASDDFGGVLQSPRIEGKALVTEMVSNRWNLSRATRQELAPKPLSILVAADVSGSCSASSGATVGICQVLTKLWPELVFVVHANGYVLSVTRNGVCDSYHAGIHPTFPEIVANTKVAGVLLFGDCDGVELIAPIWEQAKCPTIWLDSYSVKNGIVFRSDYRKVYGFPITSGNHPVQYFAGVNSAESAAVALRQVCKQQ